MEKRLAAYFGALLSVVMLGYWLPDSVWGSTNGMLPQTAIITTIDGVGKTAVSPIKKHRQKRIKRGCQVFSL